MSHARSPDVAMACNREASMPPPGMTSLSSIGLREVGEGKLGFWCAKFVGEVRKGRGGAVRDGGFSCTTWNNLLGPHGRQTNPI
jgi:hypothetical protein